MTYTFKLAARLARLRYPIFASVAAALVAVACNPTGTGLTGPNGPDTTGTTPPIASLTLTPGSASEAVGGSLAFSVTIKDANGNVVTDTAITWASDAPTIATVSSTGLVTGHHTGNAKISATSHGKSDTATVTVVDTTTPPPPPDTTTTPPPDTTTPPPPPPPSGTWAHEPSGWSFASEDPFDSLKENGWDVVWNSAGNASIVSDPTAPYSPNSVLQMAYPVGFAGGSGPANVWRPLPSLTRIYSGFYWKASDPWQGHSSNVNKILFMFPSSGGDIYITMYGPPGGPYQLRVLPQFTGLPSNWLVPNVNNVPVTVGTWHKIEWVIDYNGGVVQWWMDGVMIGNYSNVAMPSGPMIEYKINPTWGGVGDTKTENDYFRYDHIRVSGN